MPKAVNTNPLIFGRQHFSNFGRQHSSNNISANLRRSGAEFGFLCLVAGSAEERVGRVFALFDAGLIEGIDAEQRACIGGLELEVHNQLAERKRIEFGQNDRMIGLAGFGDREFGRLTLGLNELAHRMTAKEVDVGELLAACRDFDLFAVVLDRDEGDDLVVGAFGIELDLAVLIGYAESLDRGLTLVAGGAVEVLVLAEGLRPQLAIPIRHVLEPVRIGHHDADVFAALHREILEHRSHQRRVTARVGVAIDFVCIRRAPKQALDIDADCRRRKQADRAELGESAADAVGNVEGLVALFLRDFDEVAAVLGCGRNDVLCDVLFAQLLLEHIADDQILGHRLGGAAALGDDVEDGLFGDDDVGC